MLIQALAALAYLTACLAVVGFQLALTAGAPWAHLTQGGRYRGPLRPAGRAVAGLSIFLLLAMSGAIVSAAGFWPHWPVAAGWGALGMQIVVAALNGLTPSAPERRLWGPVTLAMAGLAGAVMIATI